VFTIYSFVKEGKRLEVPSGCVFGYFLFLLMMTLISFKHHSEMITRCWAHSPEDRPSAEEIVAWFANREADKSTI